MHQNRFRLGLCPRPSWGSLHAPPDPLAVFKGPTSKGKEGEGEVTREEEGKGKGKGEEGENDLTHPRRKFLATPLILLGSLLCNNDTRYISFSCHVSFFFLQHITVVMSLM